MLASVTSLVIFGLIKLITTYIFNFRIFRVHVYPKIEIISTHNGGNATINSQCQFARK